MADRSNQSSDQDQERWLQRLSQLTDANRTLQDNCAMTAYSDLERSGLIKNYELAFELSWKTLKDFLAFGGQVANSPRETIRLSHASGLLGDAREWLRMLEFRNQLSHCYSEAQANDAVKHIRGQFAANISTLVATLESHRHDA